MVGLRQVGDHPGGEGLFDHVPGSFQPIDDLGDTAGNSFWFCQRLHLSGQRSAAGRVHALEPVDAAQADVAGDLPGGTQVRCGPVQQLLRCQRRDGMYDANLVRIPPLENGF
jgi:hypothetical protein